MSHKLLDNLDVKLHEIDYSNCGVYFLCDEKFVLYIGKSAKLAHRIDRHKQAKTISFTQAHFISCSPSELDDLEIKYIRQFKPSFNKQLYDDHEVLEAGQNLINSIKYGIVCIKCNSANIRCIDSRPSHNNTIRRRRKCGDCKYRFTTFETCVHN